MPASLARWVASDRDDWTAPAPETCKALAHELGRAKAALDKGLAPAGDAFIGAMLGRLAVAAKMRAEDSAEWAARAREYLRLLGHYPADLWWDAVDRWLLDQPWFPSIAELNLAMFAECERRRRALERVEAMLRLAGGEAAAALEAPACAVWRDARGGLIAALGEQAFKTWLDVLLPLSDDGDELVLGAPTEFIAGHAKEAFGEAIEAATGRRLRIVKDQRAAAAATRAQRGFRGRGW